MEDWKMTSFGPNDIDNTTQRNVYEAAEINFGHLSEKGKQLLK